MKEMIRVVELDPITVYLKDGEEEEVRIRVEIFRDMEKGDCFGAHSYRLGSYRMLPSFPQGVDGKPSSFACDERVWVEDLLVDERTRESTPEKMLENAIGQIRRQIGS